MKEIENAGFQSLDIIKQKYPRKEQWDSNNSF
jgi:hypothetical protein